MIRFKHYCMRSRGLRIEGYCVSREFRKPLSIRLFSSAASLMCTQRPIRISNDADLAGKPFHTMRLRPFSSPSQSPPFFQLTYPPILRCKFKTQFGYCERLVPSGISRTVPRSPYPTGTERRLQPALDDRQAIPPAGKVLRPKPAEAGAPVVPVTCAPGGLGNCYQ